MAKIRVVVADDHQEWIHRVRRTLDDNFKVVDAVSDGEQAIDAVSLLCPDVLVIDTAMPVLGGLEAARRLEELKCPTKIVLLTVHADRDFAEAAFAAGASGYVLKALLTRDLIPAIYAALHGSEFVSGWFDEGEPTRWIRRNR